MDRIQKISRYFIVILNCLLGILPTFVIIKWIYIDSSLSVLGSILFSDSYNGKWLVDVIWSPLAKAIGISAYLLELAPVLISLLALIHVFKNYQKGEVFSAINARYFRRIGWMFIFYGLVAKTLYDTLMSLATTINNPPGERMIGVGFGSPNLEALFCGFVVIIVSWVMLEASKLHEDQKYTV